MTEAHDEGRTMGTVATAALAAIAMVLSGGALIVAIGTGGAAEPVAAAETADGDEAAETADGDEAAAPAEAPTDVAVSLTEFAVGPEAIEVAAGGTLTVTNDGSAEHDLAIDGADIGTAMLGAGGAETLSIDGLEPGVYDVRCTVPGHDSAGMTGTLNVVGEGGAALTDDAVDEHAAHGAGGDEDWEALDAAMHDTMMEFPAETEGTGNQLLEPAEILEDGTKRYELTAEIIEWERAPGDVVEGWAYNGMIPGPQIRAEVGDKLQVDVTNELPMGTDVHWHGIIVPNDQDGVSPYTQELIQPGETYSYEFELTEPAISMYHPHHHAQMKVPNGMWGTIIVGDLPLPDGRTVGGVELPETIEVAQELPMVVNDAGTIGMSLNGKSFPATEPIVAKQGDWILMHYYNEGLQIHPMHLHGQPQLVVAKDGFPLDAPQWEDTVNVAPGERYSVLVHAKDVGTWAFHCHILTHAESHEGMFGMVTALIVEEA